MGPDACRFAKAAHHDSFLAQFNQNQYLPAASQTFQSSTGYRVREVTRGPQTISFSSSDVQTYPKLYIGQGQVRVDQDPYTSIFKFPNTLHFVAE